MSELRIETWSMPGADLGPECPLPPLRTAKDPHEVKGGPGVPKDVLRNMVYGRVPNPLPYTVQNGYTRQLRLRGFRVAVLENECLRATFLLELGGRLWSLVHKPSGRELLECNPVFQPANLAIRNAWFSGGVEWNIGTIGHCAFTCSPVFAARLRCDDGTPVLRLYEWERIRQVPFQIDAYLPDGSPVLFVRVRIVNSHGREVPMYWWSNIAVPETRRTRVVVPAESAFKFGYGGAGMGLCPIPAVDGTDVSYPTNSNRSTDYFFYVPDGRRRWIAALGDDGMGLVQTSTDRLTGRKLFLWGRGAGGRRWQAFLSKPGHAYIEIQAGLARTQAEHVPMPAGADWAWLEAYGLMEADPAAVHGDDWASAQEAVEAKLEGLIPRAELDAEFDRGSEMADRAPEEVIQRASGWGALEALRRESRGEPPFCSQRLVFDEQTIGRDEAPWLALLRGGAFPDIDPTAAPSAFMVQAEWRELLEDAVAAGRGANWAAWLHLGVMRYHDRDREGAATAWERSLEEADTAWARRNLAVLAREDDRLDEAADLYIAACRMRPSLLPLALECGQTLIQAGRHAEWLEVVEALPEPVRLAGRIRLLEGQAALAVRDFGRVRGLLDGAAVVDDLREGERSLSNLWFEYHEQRVSAEEGLSVDDALRARVRRDFPVPPALDFRMSADPPVRS